MARLIKTKKETIGLSPDMILFKGEKKSDFTKISAIDYNSKKINELEIKNSGEFTEFNNSKTTTWINIDGLHDEEIMQEISVKTKLDSFVIPDVLDTYARPKIQEYDNCIYVSTKILHYDESTDQISSENLVLLIKEHILLSFQEKEGNIFDAVRNQLRKNKKLIRSSKTDYLAFALLDTVIDNYILIISQVGEKIESLDDEIITNDSDVTLGEINNFKGEINYLRKSIKPSQEMIMNLARLDSDLIHKNTSVHLKELQENIKHANELLDSYREILSDQLNVYQTNVSNKLNVILKFLTIFSVIFIPLTFIAGIYGTNFDNIPELHFKYGYFVMWGVIIIVAVSMIIHFKVKKWF